MLRLPLILPLCFIVYGTSLSAQIDTVPVSAIIHANNIRATVWSDGVLFSDENGGAFFPDYTEQGPNISPIEAAGLWLGYTDPAGSYWAEITRGLNEKNGFNPGLIDPVTREHIDFNKIWRVTREEIIAHIMDYQDNQIIDNPIPAIFAWPARGNQFFEQYNDGMTLPSSDFNLAHFDQISNFNSLYDPDKGDYPLPIRGITEYGLPSEILWFSFHEAINVLGSVAPTEIHCGIYVYDCSENEILDNTIFVEYQVVNRGYETNCGNIGIWADVAIGCPDDDYIGSIPGRDIVYAYNSDNLDEACDGYQGYGENPPALGIRWIEAPYAYIPEECYHEQFSGGYKTTTISIDQSPDALPGKGFPTTTFQILRYLNGLWKDGQPLTWGGQGYQTGLATEHIFPGDPANPDEWSELSANQPPGKRTILSSVGPFELPATPSHAIGVLAFTFVRKPEKNHLENIAVLPDSLRYLTTYHVDPPYLHPTCTSPVPVAPPQEPATKIKVFPNPASHTIFVQLEGMQIHRLLLRDALGKIIRQTEAPDTNMAVADIAPGLYFLNVEMDDGSIQMSKVIITR